VKPLDAIEAVLKDAHTLLKADPSFGPSLASVLREFYVKCDYKVPNKLDPTREFYEETRSMLGFRTSHLQTM